MVVINIEEYTPDHNNGVRDLILAIQQDEFQISITIADQPDLTSIDSFYQNGKGNFWVARSENRVIGTIALLDIGNDNTALRKMFVKKEFRGKEFNVGQRLLETLIGWANENGIKKIFLGTTEKFTAAQRFYEKNNFQEVSKSSLPVEFPVMKVDVKFYELSLR